MLSYDNELFRIISEGVRLEDELSEGQALTKELIKKLGAKRHRMEKNNADARNLEANCAEIVFLKEYEKHLQGLQILINTVADIFKEYGGFHYIQSQKKK